MTSVSEIPVAHTPAGGYQGSMPSPVLAGCDDPLIGGAPDLRGLWTVVAVDVQGEAVGDHPMIGTEQRIEQAGDRLVVTAGGVVHDMRCDGTLDNGVHDVAAADFTTQIHVVASYRRGVHVLRPTGVTAEVTRALDGDHMVWGYAGLFTARLARVG